MCALCFELPPNISAMAWAANNGNIWEKISFFHRISKYLDLKFVLRSRLSTPGFRIRVFWSDLDPVIKIWSDLNQVWPSMLKIHLIWTFLAAFIDQSDNSVVNYQQYYIFSEENSQSILFGRNRIISKSSFFSSRRSDDTDPVSQLHVFGSGCFGRIRIRVFFFSKVRYRSGSE